METKSVKFENLNLFTESFGNPKNTPVLLIAGAAAPGDFWSDEFCKTLAQRGYFVIRYDHPDTGKSTVINWEEHPYTFDDLAKYSLAVLDAYNIEKAHLVGHSMGGYLVQWLGAYYPHRVLSLVSISAGPIGSTPETDQPLSEEEKKLLDKTWQIFLERKPADTYQESVEGFLKVWKYLNGQVEFDEEMARNYTRALFKGYVSQGMSRNHEKIMQDISETLSDRRNILKKITLLTLVIQGRQDPIVLQSHGGRAIANQIPHAELIEIPQMGHMFFNKNLEQNIIDKLDAFFKRQVKDNYMNDVIIGKGNLAGKGVYANRDFKKGEVVVQYNIKPLTKEEYERLPDSEKMFTHRHWGQLSNTFRNNIIEHTITLSSIQTIFGVFGFEIKI